MTGATYQIGSSVYCSDARCGQLLQLEIDPVARRLTRLVVFGARERAPHLVPLGLAAPTELGVLLACGHEEFEELRSAENAAEDAAPDPAALERGVLPEMRIRRGDHVHAADGDAGRITGITIRPEDGFVTGVLVCRRHWWRRDRPAIPAEVVVGFGAGGVTVGLTRSEIEELPRQRSRA